MAVDIIHDTVGKVACFYCTTSDSAFGPVFTGPTAGDDADAFLEWLDKEWSVTYPRPSGMNVTSWTGDGSDPRDYALHDLERLVTYWRTLQEDEGDGREPNGQRWDGERWVSTDR